MSQRPRDRALSEWGRLGGIASGLSRRGLLPPRARRRTKWRTITFAVPPDDYARLTAITLRDGSRYSTLAREALQAYLNEVLNP